MKLEDSIFSAPAQDIGEIIKNFGLDGAELFASQLPTLATSIATLVLLVWGVKTVVFRDMSILSKQFFPLLITLTAVLFLLARPTMVFEWLLWPLEDLVIRASGAMMFEFSPVGFIAPPDELNSYARLVWNVELLIQWVIVLAARLVDSAPFLTFEIIIRLFAAIILGAPYFFIGCLHMLYMAEAAFVFALSGILSPMMMVAYVAPVGRQYAYTMLRLMLASGMTVFLAICAISLTGAVIKDNQAVIQHLLDPSASVAVAEAKAEVADLCRSKKGQQFDPVKCTEAREKLNFEEEPKFEIMSPAFLRVVAVGFLSMFLHLASKTLASSIAGVQGGPGAAAGVAGLATAAAGTGLALTKGVIGKGVSEGRQIGSRFLPNLNPFGSGSPGGGNALNGGNSLREGGGVGGDSFRGPPQSPVNPRSVSGMDGVGDLDLRDVGKSTTDGPKEGLKAPPEKPKFRD